MTVVANAKSRHGKQNSIVKVVCATSIGNALEWFDFVIYGYFASILATLFFPSEDKTFSTLMAMTAFSLAFIIRPFGSFVIGAYADRFGRKNALSLTIWLMVLGTGMIGFAPTAATAGSLGAFIILLARVIQGLAASGEYGSAVSLLAESAPPNRRNFVVSWQMSSTMLAIVMAGLIGIGLTSFLDDAALHSWGWRVPFLFGLILGPVGWYIRTKLEEPSSAAERATGRWTSQFRALFVDHGATILLVIGMSIVSTVGFYLMMIYTPTYAVTQLGLPLGDPFLATTLAGLTMAVAAPIGGLIADKRGSGFGLVGAAMTVILVISVPLFLYLVAHPSRNALIFVQVLLALPYGMMSGVIPAVMAASFPTSVRATALGASYNLASTIFGGFSMLAVTALIGWTGDKAIPGYAICVAAAASLASLRLLHSRASHATHA